MLCRSHNEVWNLTNHMKKQNKKHQNVRSIGKKLRSKSLLFFISYFSCDLQDFKFWYVNRWAFGGSFLHWVDFTKKNGLDCSILNVFPLYKSSFGLLSSRHNYYAQRWLNHIFSFARPSISMYCCFVTFSLQWISQVPTLFMTSLPHFFCLVIQFDKWTQM